MKIITPLLGSVVAIALVLFMPLARANNGNMLTVVTVGDSTVADYPLADPLRGWGQILNEYFKPSTKIVNVAICGRSTKTFFETGNWEKALNTKPNFIFIQFGHNDSHAKSQPESTDANTDYMVNLRRYVGEARKAQATPILVTPPHRLIFDGNTGKLTQELKPYAEAMKRVAEEMEVSVIDLYELSGETFEPMGEGGVAGMTATPQDRTHFTEKGARILAGLVAREAAKIDSRLQSALK
ncbi:MAG: rhamnogalacturonan acetylesterase [Chthoniobacteraceae bacterium]